MIKDLGIYTDIYKGMKNRYKYNEIEIVITEGFTIGDKEI